MNHATGPAPPEPQGPPDGSPEARADAVERYFEGDAALFAVMLQQSKRQFLQDLQDGDAALQRGDGAALRRVAHSLKTVLRMLGHPRMANMAHYLESSAAGDDRSVWPSLWQALRNRIERLSTSPD
jgi:HPt (histidine-containing phosphotransfer) domain-containing protein